MTIFVKAKPGSKKEGIQKIDDSHFIISVRARSTEGNANAAIIKAIAGYFDTAPSRIKIIRGVTSRQKVIELKWQ
ncbi:MAG: hypothetical protein A2745_03325 [Candidatus Harrisonbacteria bacterium RIFCSPHIGHO2_01_FULL_44_13]|uniref:Uncharacterized protein n=1 Tax=Candidatus Harrisonbacteria bacterium RIFCSPLOWO2_01_FULL_44_18 TaxID=1798407 RepID=A0A1G1ZPN2_9BACT|nr:MAG: hypothetical protein A2745_03325 [Candidatus Harrisonbacteria bacterium RIFCSPHIGHO2_01_FULL_44_13]OGY66389.1 MAG: hypothetical protein A3A16_03410 [Candidatus Harrisonbacteria bacterium RIFCSPLOWO2_01_FULL_44_18]